MFEDMTVGDLKVAAKILGVSIKGASKKSDIISVIHSAGYSYLDYTNMVDEQFSYKEGAERTAEDIEVKDETKSQEMVLLKMTYPRGAINVSNKAYFTIEEPYRVFSREKAEEIIKLAQGEVMMATPEEVASFYGIKK